LGSKHLFRLFPVFGPVQLVPVFFVITVYKIFDEVNGHAEITHFLESAGILAKVVIDDSKFLRVVQS
jgi:hypothetical protein